MAKQRPWAKSKAQLSAASRNRPGATPAARRMTARKQSQRPNSAPPARAPAQAASPARRSTYFEAVALYERGLAAIQQHDYPAAVERLQSVLRLYPEEKELHERVRLYLNVCARQAAPRQATPQTLDERLYAATLAINGGRHDEAILHLRLVRDEDPDNDHALYMLAVAHAQRGEPAEAVTHLERAIALNPENWARARHDPDLDPLRNDDAFRGALEAAPGFRGFDRRRPPRTKSAR